MIVALVVPTVCGFGTLIAAHGLLKQSQSASTEEDLFIGLSFVVTAIATYGGGLIRLAYAQGRKDTVDANNNLLRQGLADFTKGDLTLEEAQAILDRVRPKGPKHRKRRSH